MLVQEFLEQSADRLPNKIALVCGEKRYTYGQIEAWANQLAHALRGLGFARGDRLAIFLPNTVEAVVALFAALKAGGVFVLLNPTTKQNKLAYILNDCGAFGLVAQEQRKPVAREAAAEAPSLRFTALTDLPAGENHPSGFLSFWGLLEGQPASRPEPVIIDLDLACLIYTSGSTGEPKGVMSDHSNVDFASSSIISYLGNREDDIVINVLPLAFDYGLYQLLMTFKYGGTLVLEPSFAFPAAVLKRIQAERVTGFPGVPTIFALLLEMDLSAFDLSSLRYLTNTAAALPPSHILRLQEKFPWVTIFSMYGLTETKRTLYLPPNQLRERPGSVGIPIPGTECWLEDEAGRRLGPNEIGELVIRGRHVMRGYWNNPEATAQRYRPGRYPGERVCYSGDLFRQDEEGYFYFVCRKDDIIKSRGEKVSPVEVEKVLYGLPGVVEAAVIGVDDPILGQAIKAFVVVKNGQLSEADVIKHCRANLEDFMVPRVVEFCGELPKTESGKIRKMELR